jgi:hypothetical protein
MIPLVFSTASLLLCGFFFFYFHRYVRRRTSHESILAGCEDAVASLEAQIDAVTDRDARLVEERIRSLKKLLEDVDRRITLLSRLEDQRKPAEALLYNSLGNRMRFPAVSVDPTLPGAALASAASPAPVPQAVTAGEALPAHVPEAGEDTRSLVERVAELDRAGFSPELIASRLKVSISEAELALTVFRHSRSGGLG